MRYYCTLARSFACCVMAHGVVIQDELAAELDELLAQAEEEQQVHAPPAAVHVAPEPEPFIPSSMQALALPWLHLAFGVRTHQRACRRQCHLFREYRCQARATRRLRWRGCRPRWAWRRERATFRDHCCSWLWSKPPSLSLSLSRLNDWLRRTIDCTYGSFLLFVQACKSTLSQTTRPCPSLSLSLSLLLMFSGPLVRWLAGAVSRHRMADRSCRCRAAATAAYAGTSAKSPMRARTARSRARQTCAPTRASSSPAA